MVCLLVRSSGFVRAKENKAYFMSVGSKKIPVYCHMTSVGLGACGGGGWTLAIKMDGAKVLTYF